ncbi:MAG: F0F1 ATP synthase subunit B [Pelobium sp.]
MQINWFTVIAQLFNFLVLVWLMKKYLYKPILDAIDKRESKIATELADAKSKVSEAKKEQEDFQKKNDAFDADKKKMMNKATADAEKERQKLLDKAQTEAEALKNKMEQASKELQENLNADLVQKTQQQVLSIAKQALAQLASTTLEEQAVHVFIAKIKSLSAKEKTKFTDAFHSATNPVSIKSAFELSDKEQKNIKASIADLLGETSDYAFETHPKTISGIELASNGYKLSWNFSAYIASLQKSLTSPLANLQETERN